MVAAESCLVLAIDGRLMSRRTSPDGSRLDLADTCGYSIGRMGRTIYAGQKRNQDDMDALALRDDIY